MSLWKKGSPIEMLQLNSARDFISVLLPSSIAEHGMYNYVCRGQANSESWTLTPPALRKYEPSTEIDWHQHAMDEFSLVRDFLLEADKTGLPIPGDSPDFREPFEIFSETNIEQKVFSRGPMRDPWPLPELLWPFAVAQHHGIPTTLLDWTEQPYIAAYFAAISTLETSSAESLVVWLLNTNSLTKLFPYGRGMTDPLGIHLINVARAGNRNLSAQKGLFSLLSRRVGESTSVDSESMEQRVYQIDQYLEQKQKDGTEIGTVFSGKFDPDDEIFSSPVLLKVTLASKQAPYLLEILYMMDYHAGFLFPGYHGVAQMMQERNLWRDVLLDKVAMQEQES